MNSPTPKTGGAKSGGRKRKTVAEPAPAGTVAPPVAPEPAAEPAAKPARRGRSALNPAAGWPFPTGARPK